MNEKCEIAEDEKHCLHLSIGVIGFVANNASQCCHCGQVEQLAGIMDGKPHGKFLPLPYYSPLQWDYSKLIPFTPTSEENVNIWWQNEYCAIEEFFKMHPNETSCLITCQCSKHRVSFY